MLKKICLTGPMLPEPLLQMGNQFQKRWNPLSQTGSSLDEQTCRLLLGAHWD